MRHHLFDMATNKALDLSARSETRDLVEIMELDAIYPLEAIIWAACGKDEGFSPLLLLEMMRRVAFVDPAGNPGWIGTHPHLRPHPTTLRGCWPNVNPPEP